MIGHSLEHPEVAAVPTPSFRKESKPPMTRDRKRVLLIAGGLGVLSAGLIAAAPELGAISAFASIVAGGASAVTTLIAKR